MTTTELIELLKKYERGGATGRPREVMFEVCNRIIDTYGIEVIGAGDGLISELYLSLPDAEQKWMPVADKLPNKYGNYLITTSEGEVDLGSYDPDRPGSWSACDAKGFHWVGDVVAWMSLPNAYKGGNDA